MKNLNLTELREKQMELHESKTQAINERNYEEAAKIRDKERQCREAIERLEKEAD